MFKLKWRYTIDVYVLPTQTDRYDQGGSELILYHVVSIYESKSNGVSSYRPGASLTITWLVTNSRPIADRHHHPVFTSLRHARLKSSHRVTSSGELNWSEAWSKQGRRCADEVHPLRRQVAPRMTSQQCCVTRCTLAQYWCSTSFFVAWKLFFQSFRTIIEYRQILSLQFIETLATGWTIFSPAQYRHST
jgi:hypothetical protein